MSETPEGSRLLRWQERRGFPRPIEPTRGGWWFLMITFAVGVAAINTGNNLLYLVLGMLLALILASGVLSHLSLLHIEALRSSSTGIHAHSDILVGIGLKNGKRRLPSFCLEVSERIRKGELVVTTRRCFFLRVAPANEAHGFYPHRFLRRGRYAVEGLRVATSFPFGLFVKYLFIRAPGEIVVYPALLEAGALGYKPSGDGEKPRFERGRHGEFFAVRDYREGDAASDIHWRVTARAGRLVVREREDEAANRVTIELDNGLADDSQRELDALELRVSEAATNAVKHLGQGDAVAVTARGSALAYGVGAFQRERVLRFLATIEGTSAQSPFTLPSGGQPQASLSP